MLGAATKFPAPEICPLGSGYGKKNLCLYRPWSQEELQPCSNAAFPQEACVDNSSSADFFRMYSRDVRSKSEFNKLLSVVAKVEGSSIMTQGGAGFSYVQTSAVTHSSVAFFYGGAGTYRQRQVLRPGSLKLKSIWKRYLKNEPKGFLARFGMGYVHTIQDGGSFLGSFTINTANSADTRDISAFVDISQRFGIFTATGSVKFGETATTKKGRVEIHAKANIVGGHGTLVSSFGEPLDMVKLFNSWQKTWRTNPKPISVLTSKWRDSRDVQGIVNFFSEPDWRLFMLRDISSVVQEMISKEIADRKSVV